MENSLKFFEKIKQYQNICIFGHISPDGDCYGSQMSMKKFILELFPEKNVYVLGTGFNKAIPYFGKMDQITDEIVSSSLAILVDCTDLFRVEDQRIHTCKELIRLDHHLGSEVQGTASVILSNIEASSACQMVGDFIIDLGYTLSKEIAECIFMGIITDSGRFQYLSSCKGTFLLMEKIMEAKIDFQKIYDFLYEGDEVSTRAKGYIGYNFKTYKGVAYIILTKEELRNLNIDYNYASTMVNVLSQMEGYPIWCSFAESEEGLIRVEIRAKHYNVQQVALLFGGGGHLNASGCRLYQVEDCQKVIEELAKII